jgi:ribose transport system permease protein
VSEAAVEAGRAPQRAGGRGSQFSLREIGIVIAFVALFFVLSIASDVFLTKENLLNIADQWAPTAIIACGATIVIISGGFDLSSGAIFALSGIIAVKAANSLGVAPGFVLGLLLATACGLANGILVTAGRVNTFIGTLASSIILRGFAVSLTGGYIVASESDAFTNLGRQELLGAKLSVFIMIAVIALCAWLLGRTVFGRHVFAVGSNREAARLAGVRVEWIRCGAFVLSGLLAGVAGIIVASRAGSAQADAASGIEFTAIAAVVIGGNSIFGGQGAIWRSILGIGLLALIRNGFNLLSVDPNYQQMVEGAIIVAAVAVDAWTRKRE